ncbi:methyl-accepting chemotaxis protein [Saccharospirillum mangrovi]|uniref:methyl-accepting chemotaxis protein n=1 Tax=Saccharospirillum mangrovi TaxID=2161747 RepID=UPI000D3C88C4|nr:methyl-accepting chemotaxis protein [Saccharospirillum mangrovi]
MKHNSGKVLTLLGTNRQLGLLLGALLVVILALVVLVYQNFRLNGIDQDLLDQVGELRVLSQEIAKNASEASAGQSDAFASLQRARDAFQARYDYVLDGNDQNGTPPLAEHAANIDTEQLAHVWASVSRNAERIVESRDIILNLHAIAEVLAARVPEMQVEYDEVVEIMLRGDAEPAQVALATRQIWLAERIMRSINRVRVGGEGAVVAADNFERDAIQFQRVLNGMRQGSADDSIEQVQDLAARETLDEIDRLFERVSASVRAIIDTSPELLAVRESAGAIFAESQYLLEETSALAARIQQEANQRPLGSDWILYGLGALALVLVMLAVFIIVRDTQRDLRATAAANEQNQNAILRLLDELADLADGDLTAQATVTEDFTGAIADSINFAIDQMRQLVSSINSTAVEVSAAAQQTQATAMHLAEASDHQAQEISGASAAVNEMAMSIDQVSTNALESAGVAERSVDIAKKGADGVQATISGMDNIREQIQDTSKRIKRLGESSQEIGDIVSLINDIADQTNILALNAAIQASMAGDTGRGFAVVADEVQRLAERSSAATRQIEALVNTIQNDTNEAVLSMEQTVAEVVRGAHLAQDAGVALEEIEAVSRTLANLIQAISNAARKQASSAGHISNTMNVIQEITSQTSAGTNATARSIGNLAQLANDLRSSVAGFKLPPDEAIVPFLPALDDNGTIR